MTPGARTVAERIARAECWVVWDARGPLVNTVSDTRRAAIVNWLVTETGMMVTQAHDDVDIENAWRRSHEARGAVVGKMALVDPAALLAARREARREMREEAAKVCNEVGAKWPDCSPAFEAALRILALPEGE